MLNRKTFMQLRLKLLLALAASIVSASAKAQDVPRPIPPELSSVVADIPVNYDESKVGTYTLPDPLILLNGKPVHDIKTWNEKRRPEIIRLFEDNEYGRSPGRPADMTFDVFDKGTPALNGKAIRKQITIYFTKDKNGPKMDLLEYLPAAAKKRVPLLLNISFSPNSLVVEDPGIRPSLVWDAKTKTRIPATRGLQKLDVIPWLDAGFGIATFLYTDLEPDTAAGLPVGVRSIYLKSGQTQPAPDEWGSFAAWGWGISRAMDYLETDPGVDAKRVGITGSSRLGKTVLWAAARDTRFALVIASCSGEAGAALSRRNYGESIAIMTAPTRGPYHFAANYQKYGGHEDQLPMDAHMLIALIAPRPLLLQTADLDFWSDPKGEFLAAVAAAPVYKLLNKDPLDTDQWPMPKVPILHDLGYYMHDGPHGIVPSDWPIYLDFMKMHLHPER
jgi:hypothetical protein